MQKAVVDRARTLAVPGPLAGRAITLNTRHWSILFGAGIAFATIGFTDVLLLWYPLRFGSLDWEFATLAGTFDALPLATIGIVMVGVGAVALEKARTAFVLSLLSLGLCVALAAAAGLFVLAVLAGMSAVDPAVEMQFRRAVMKTSVLAFLYVSFYGWLAWVVGRAGQLKGESV
jgi:hypothetical protein